LSVFESIEQLSQWVYGPMHRAILVPRHNWLERVSEATTALWWVSEAPLPTTLEAESRVLHLRQHGPAATAFTFKETFDPPSDSSRRPSH
jgi:hypothetical protein